MTTIPFADRITATIDETCAATGISRSSIYPLLKSGAIEYVMVNKRRMPLVASVLRYINSLPRDAASVPSEWGTACRKRRVDIYAARREQKKAS